MKHPAKIKLEQPYGKMNEAWPTHHVGLSVYKKTLEKFNILSSGLLKCIVYPPSLTLAAPLASTAC